MDRQAFLRRCRIALGCVGILALALFFWGVAARQARQEQGGELPGAAQQTLVQPGCVQCQTLVYKRCGHSVTRTLDAPLTWVGRSRTQLEEQLDMSWRITDFLPTVVTLRRDIMLFCPQHWVLMPDESGRVCLWVNRYGEGMERVYETEWMLQHMPPDERERVRIGMAFDLLEEAEGFLEGLEG